MHTLPLELINHTNYNSTLGHFAPVSKPTLYLSAFRATTVNTHLTLSLSTAPSPLTVRDRPGVARRLSAM